MPLYEYTCGSCGNGFTLLQSMNTDPKEAVCPECGKAEATRQFSAFAPSMGSGGSTPAMPPCGMGGGGCGGGMCGM